MSCASAREQLLEADLGDLTGAGDSELAQHLRQCGACRAGAERILADSGDLAAALAHIRPRRPVAESVERAATNAASLRVRRRALRRRLTLVTPLALAAGVGALLVLGNGNGGPVAPVPAATLAASPPPLDVETPAGTNVTVFHTDNPQIVVIWYYPQAQ